MNEEYDYIVLGTGLKECILSGMLSVNGFKILHMDRNSYYGGESASLNLEQLYKKFKPEQKIPEELGRTRDYNVDLCPKFIMACGNLVKMLLHTKVTRYLEFKSVAGSYVMKDGNVYKVPASSMEAASTSLMGFWQKTKFKKYLSFIEACDVDDEKTWQGIDINKVTNKELFEKFGCDDNTQAFTGHAMALFLNDKYQDEPCRQLIENVKLYAYSVSRYGNSPYIYPVYGLGGLPEGFSRLSAIHGGTYMLNKPVDEILYDDEFRVCGVKSEGEVARCKKLLADPSYFFGTDKVKKTGQVARCICILGHPINGTSDADSAQIIIPFKQVPGRRTDIYVSCVSFQHQVAPNNKWIAVIQLQVETDKPKAEMQPALNLLGKRDADFFWVSDIYEPANNPNADNCFITNSYDAISHFEPDTAEVMKLFEMMTGKQVDLTANPDPENLGE